MNGLMHLLPMRSLLILVRDRLMTGQTKPRRSLWALLHSGNR